MQVSEVIPELQIHVQLSCAENPQILISYKSNLQALIKHLGGMATLARW